MPEPRTKFGLLALGLLLGGALVVTSSCGGGAKTGTDSNTHWLRVCSDDGDCGGLECLCGVCTRACDDGSQCGGLGSSAVCEPISGCSDSAETTSVCTAECDGDCTAVGANLTCIDGICENASNTDTAQAGSAGVGNASANGGKSSTGPNQTETAGAGGSSAANGSAGTGRSSTSGGAQNAGGTSPATGGVLASAGGNDTNSGSAGSGGVSSVAGAGAGGEPSGGAARSSGGTDATGGTTGSEGGAGGATVSGNRLVLAPSSLVFFGLPIGSIRYAVVGYDAAARICATMVWEGSETPRCNDSAYVIIKADTDGPCTDSDWDDQGNVATTSLSGCVTFADTDGVDPGMVDVEVQVEGSAFTGTIVANNRPEGLVTFGLEYVTDEPEDIYVQTNDELGMPAWIHVTKDGKPVALFEDCGIPNCDYNDGVCGMAIPQTANITNGATAGSIYINWDGQVWSVDQENQCLDSAPATAGTYQLEVCYGTTVNSYDPAGSEVLEPLVCRTQDFTYPTDEVTVRVDSGG